MESQHRVPAAVATGPPRIAVGGRWRALEEENQTLAAELAAHRCEVSAATSACAAAESIVKGSEEIAAASQKECAEAKIEATELRCEISILRCNLNEASEAAEQSRDYSEQLEKANEILLEELFLSQEDSDVLRKQASALRASGAACEVRVRHEVDAMAVAESSCERLRAELEVMESRLANRGTHVDLLLRDKERLWTQLSRARRQSEGGGGCGGIAGGKDHMTTTKPRELAIDGNTDSSVNPNRELCDSSSGNGRVESEAKGAGVRTASAPSRPSKHTKKQPTAKARLSQPGSGDARIVAGVATPAACKSRTDCKESRTAELERKLWHLQKALEKERTAHEQTRATIQRYPALRFDVEACSEPRDLTVRDDGDTKEHDCVAPVRHVLAIREDCDARLRSRVDRDVAN
eukprot:TRINITY_DN68558_c0_g1_i1.p1 TRINITY_DN68558_c0_g1~~TRINITY_DN68558_c0_g1_i1.p1  ORF type:complete len:408 (+),score=70.93 TRINITY_DN68558_c0_g1_i1:85-1308(+)